MIGLLIHVVIVLLIIGLVWSLVGYIPIDAKFKQIIRAVVIVGIIIWLLGFIGVWGDYGYYHHYGHHRHW